MSAALRYRVVIGTNILFEGLTQRGSAPGLIVDAWLANLMDVYVSNALAYEYTDVLSRKFSEQRLQRIKPVLGALLRKAKFVAIYYTWRPVSPDPADEHVIDCAMNAGAMVVTSNRKDFRLAQRTLGLRVLTAAEFVAELAGE